MEGLQDDGRSRDSLGSHLTASTHHRCHHLFSLTISGILPSAPCSRTSAFPGRASAGTHLSSFSWSPFVLIRSLSFTYLFLLSLQMGSGHLHPKNHPLGLVSGSLGLPSLLCFVNQETPSATSMLLIHVCSLDRAPPTSPLSQLIVSSKSPSQVLLLGNPT